MEPSSITFETARAFGDVWVMTELWHELGFDRLRQAFGRTRHAIDIEALLRIMVFNRLCDPESKLGVLRWLETVSLPGLSLESVSHQQLLRAMDALVDQQAAVEKTVAQLLRPLVADVCPSRRRRARCPTIRKRRGRAGFMSPRWRIRERQGRPV